jgi:hypothetical protein
MESNVLVASSSSNIAIVKMEEKIIPEMVDYWKKMVEYPRVDGTTVVCFESHLVAGLGLSPSKFLIAVMSHLDRELVHFNPNAIATLSCFVMLCES